VARGARRPKSPFAGKLDFGYEADFTFQRSRRSELHALREVSLRETHSALRRELGLVRQAAYGAALIEQTTEMETPLPEIHALFAGLVKHLPQQPPKPRTVFAFELRLLKCLGLEPDPLESKLPTETQKLLTALAETPWSELGALRATAAQARAVQQFLHGFLIYHLGRIPKGRQTALVP
jgi:DNA repair protein RecO (recombination protein O)